MTKTLDPRVAKLPAWAKELIESLARERNAAIRTLREFHDAQEETPISYSSNPCLGEDGERGPTCLRRFIDAHKIDFSWAGVDLTVYLQEEDSHHRTGIRITAGASRMADDVAIVACGRNEISISTPNFLRRTVETEREGEQTQ